MQIVVTGSIGYDFIMDFSGRFADRIMPEAIHKISLSFLVDKLNKQFGGTAGNIGYNLKLLGVAPTIIGCVGNDFEPYRKHLKKYRIAVSGIKVYKNKQTSSYFVVTDTDDNQIGSFYIGAMKYAPKLSLPVSPKPDFVVIAPNDPTAMKKFILECRKKQIPYIYDPAFQIGNFTPEELRDGITGANILIANDYEITLIEQKLEITHEELRVMCPVVVTTLGSKGSIVETRRESIHCKVAKPLNTSDPTGAGDAYRAGFLTGYLKGYDLKVCGQMGSVAAVYTVEKYGTQTHEYTKKDFVNRYRENFGKTIKI